MNAYLLPLSDSQATLETVGGKGLSLAKMINAGLPVPGGFHITTEAYRQFVAANGLQAKIQTALSDADLSQPATLETASASIGRCFAESRIPEDVETAIREAYATLDNRQSIIENRQSSIVNRKSVAVRSSATAEDLPEMSFAGQQETYLNIRGEGALLEAVKKCWASLWTARAIAYRIKNNIDQNTVALAVVVQEMVNAEAAGILFTANPISGRRDEMVINAAWGLGEAIVGGLVSPDTIVADKATGKVKTVEIAEKTVITVLTESGTEEKPLEEARRKSGVLNEAQVAELAALARKIEDFYGSLQDIEWCHANDHFYIVQARPITALPPEPVQWLPPNPKGMYARGSLCEHLPNPVSPLFGTLGIRMVNIPTKDIGEMALGVGGGGYQYQTINGYVYLGMILGWREWLSMAKASVTLMGTMFKTSHASWHAARKDLIAAVAAGDEKDLKSLSPSALLEEARELMMAIGKFYTVIQASTLPGATSSEIVFTRVYKMVSRRDDPKAETLLFGLETEPLRAEKSLFDLGMWIRERPLLRDFTLRASTEELAAALQAESIPEGMPAGDWREFRSRFEKHIDEFGHTSYEFDFMNPTPAETPEVILDALKLYVEDKGSDPYARQQEVINQREEALKKIRGRFKLIPNRWFDKALNWATRVGPDREDSIADLGMGHTTLRRMLGELGRRFVAGGAIQTAEDIYWLVEDEVNELVSLLERDEQLPDYSARIPERKAEWQAQMKFIPPAMLPETSPWAKMMPWSRNNTTSDVLTGVAGSAGKVTATARLLFGPEDFGKMKPGDVLVAVTTTPAWTPLFAMASAIVTDLGGPLSHSSIVAREYGIPAVLATGVSTRRIRDGQTITVDGTAGKVYIEARGTPTDGATLEWPLPHPKAVLARGSFAEFVPEPVSPLFATLAVPIARQATINLMSKFGVTGENNYLFAVLNDYVYVGFIFTPKMAWQMFKATFTMFGPVLKTSAQRAVTARAKFLATVQIWQARDLAALAPSELLAGVREIFTETALYYNMAQSGTIPTSMISEATFGAFYNLLVKRKNEPKTEAFVFGSENEALRAEKALFDLAMWIKVQPELADYLTRAPADEVCVALHADHQPTRVMEEFSARFRAYLREYGHAIYDLDFAKPTPAEAPAPLVETLKVYLAGKNNPYERQRAALTLREQAEATISKRLDPLRRKWFLKLLKWAQNTAHLREDSIADVGLGHPQIRRMLGELGKRLVAGGAIGCAEDVYWLEAQELDELAGRLEKSEALESFAIEIEKRKAKWQAMKQIIPPNTLPAKAWMSKFYANNEQAGDTIKGFGASAGRVTGRACVMLGPEDFSKMQSGDVIVAGITTPAWTPLFVRAAAIVTDIGGPLSHSSIVAREYGIPAVLATGVATRRIRDGQTITVDGGAGTVTLGSM